MRKENLHPVGRPKDYEVEFDESLPCGITVNRLEKEISGLRGKLGISVICNIVLIAAAIRLLLTK